MALGELPRCMAGAALDVEWKNLERFVCGAWRYPPLTRRRPPIPEVSWDLADILYFVLAGCVP